jgi:hypothetical protein
MKTRFKFFILIIYLLSIEGIHAQYGFLGGSAFPLKPQSPLFGKDIVINDTATGDQRKVAICSAFNGWLYAAYWVKKIGSNLGSMEITIMKSENSGINWAVLRSVLTGAPHEVFTSFKIAVCGDSLSNLKLFLGLIYYDTLYHTGVALVPRLNGITGATETDILNDQFVDAHDLDLATDYNYPAANSNPGSLAILYSKHQVPADSLIFCSSSDGGMTINNHKVVSESMDQFHFCKVAINYGRSPSYSDGQYFAAWELKSINNSNFDHIYTAHTELNFNSQFTTPVCLDSLDPSGINKFRNPVIACQFSSSDNDSSNLTDVIMAEKQISPNNYDIRGFYNLQATTSRHFDEFSINSGSNNKTQPDINFNPFNSTFMLTYFDSTWQSLPFLTNDVNLSNPGSWNIISPAYNDSPDLASPYPQVKISFVQQAGIDAWISKGISGNGVALFDAPYSNYTGVSQFNSGSHARLIGVYPNPATDYITVELSGIVKETNLSIVNIEGQEFISRQISQPKTIIDISSMPSGVYFVRVTNEKTVEVGKIIKN